MDETLHALWKESSATRPPLAQLRDRWEVGTAALAQRVEPLRRRLNAATTGDRRLINLLHFPTVAVVIGVAVVVGTVYTPSYVVEVDGMALGIVTSPPVFEDVVDRVESCATDILGYNYTVDGAMTYALALTEREFVIPVADFETYLFDQTGKVMKSYVPIVNGQFIGMAQDWETLNGMLEQMKAAYVDENTVFAEFTSGVYITHEYTPSDVSQDPAAMLATFTANTNGQTIYEAQKGDTFMQIVFDNDMSMSELEALSSDVDINRIYIGQLLNVKEEIPFLFVKTVGNVTYIESIECPVVEVQDNSMYQGESKVLDAGTSGERIVNADIAYLNGVEQEHTVPFAQVTREATSKVIAVGTKVCPPWLPNGYFIWPVYERVTSYFGYRSIFGSYSYHSGIDIVTPHGTNTATTDGGTVAFAGRATGSMRNYGNLVIMDHGNGKQTYYGHCPSVLVSASNKVYQGRPIAKVSSAGRSTGSHCHFEVKIGGTPVDPLSHLS